MSKEAISYDKAELRAIVRAFKAMDEQATQEAQQVGTKLAGMALEAIRSAASSFGLGAQRVAEGGKVAKKSKIGEMSFGFAGQKFSGGGTTQILWGGLEFGSNNRKQFPKWSGSFGRGSKGYFIYPTLRAVQPRYLTEWEASFSKILKEWG